MMEVSMRKLLSCILFVIACFLPAVVFPAMPSPAANIRQVRTPEASIKVASPAGGETWVRGGQYNVTWNYAGNPGATVKVILQKSSVTVATLASNVLVSNSGKGSYLWTIDKNTPAGQDYRIVVQSNTANVKGTGGLFSISLSSVSRDGFAGVKDFKKYPISPVTVSEPKAGQTPYVPGWPLAVKWKYTGNPPGLAKVLLLKEDQIVRTFTPGTPWGNGGEGAFTASMPENEFGFTLYRVKVVSSTNDQYAGTSAEFMAMPTMKVKSPVADGQKWKVGETHIVNWKYSGGCGSKVRIKAILTSNVWAYDLQTSWPIGSNWNGSFPWTIPSGIPAGEYRIYLQSENAACSDRTAIFNVIH